jgi:tRNA(Ile2) C34 agmatinyltransferase TiaS
MWLVELIDLVIELPLLLSFRSNCPKCDGRLKRAGAKDKARCVACNRLWLKEKAGWREVASNK